MTDYRRTEQELWDEDAPADEDRRAQVVPSRIVPPTPPVNDIEPRDAIGSRDSVESLERFIADSSPLAGPSAERRLDAPSRTLAALSLLAAEDIETEALDERELNPLETEPQTASVRPPPLPRDRKSLVPSPALPSMMLGPTMSTRGDATERITTIPQTHPLANSIAPGGSALSVPPPTRRRKALRFQMALGAFALLAIGASASRFLQSRGEHHAAASAARGRGERTLEQGAPESLPASAVATSAAVAVPSEVPAQETARDLPPLPSEQDEDLADTDMEFELGHDDEPEHEPPIERGETSASASGQARAVPPSAVAPESLRISVGSVKLREGGGRSAPEPDRAQVAAALNALTARLRDCVGDEHGIADVTLTVRTPGVVSHALVEGPFAGSDKGSCIARMLRSAALPRFAEPVVRIEYPFEL